MNKNSCSLIISLVVSLNFYDCLRPSAVVGVPVGEDPNRTRKSGEHVFDLVLFLFNVFPPLQHSIRPLREVVLCPFLSRVARPHDKWSTSTAPESGWTKGSSFNMQNLSFRD